MTPKMDEESARFRALHETGCFVLPNPWDAGSARLLQHLGFEALASTSSGYAWSTGRPDYGLTRDSVLSHLSTLCNAVDLPINADFESGFASDPEGVAESVRLVMQTGVAGFSLEDCDVGRGGRLYDKAAVLERLRAARETIDRSGENVLLVARTEILLDEPDAIAEAIDKLVAFADAGADCLYAPGVRKNDDIRAIVQAVALKPVNVLVMDPNITLAEFAELGVRRVSVGGSLARVAWAAAFAAAKSIKESSFRAFADGMPSRELNGIFGTFSA